MAISLLVKPQDAASPEDPIAERLMMFQRGEVIAAKPGGFDYGSEGPPNNYIVEVTDASEAHGRAMLKPWARTVVAEVLSRSGPLYEIRLTGVDVEGTPWALSPRDIVRWLPEWGVSDGTYASNEVVFHLDIREAFMSSAFWGGDLGVAGVDLSYDSSDGGENFLFKADISRANTTVGTLRQRLMDVGGSVVSIEYPVATILLTRDSIREVFVESLADLRQKINNRQRYINEAGMQAIEAAGGSLTTTVAQLNNYVVDRAA